MEIKLGQSDKVAIIDDEDYDKIKSYKWLAVRKHDSISYYARARIRVDDHSKKYHYRYITVAMHNIIFPPPDGLIIDHINRNGLDNRKSNMRHCTASENNRNQGMRSDSRNRYRGVKLIPGYKGPKKWIARIRINGVRYTSKHFLTEREAAIAYNLMAIKYHGEFAGLNIIK